MSTMPLPPWAAPALLLLCLLYSLLSPFIFAYRHRKIRLSALAMLHLSSPRALYLEEEARQVAPSARPSLYRPRVARQDTITEEEEEARGEENTLLATLCSTDTSTRSSLSPEL